MNIEMMPPKMRQRLITKLAEYDERVAIETRSLIYDGNDDITCEGSSDTTTTVEPVCGGRGVVINTIPLPPKQRVGSHSSARFLHSVLRPPLDKYFKDHPFYIDDKYVLIIEQIYKDLYGRRAKDFDNTELKALVDVICRSSHLGDRPYAYTLVVSAKEGKCDSTRIYLLNRKDAIDILINEKETT